MKNLRIIPPLFLALLCGCASTEKIELLGNSSVGDDYYSEISPEGIVREVWHDYSIYLPFPGMHGKFKFKFEAIAEGEAEINILNNFRERETWHIATYKAVVDKNKKLTLTKTERAEPPAEQQEQPPNVRSCDISDYKTVNINGQTWLAENWNCDAPKSRCYDDKPANCDKYGRLYNWEAAKTTCPSGWHLPSDEEWNALMKFINPSCPDNSHLDNKPCAGAATKLKAASGWNPHSETPPGTDDYGFAALPGGDYVWRIPASIPNNPEVPTGSYGGEGSYGYWWSSGPSPGAGPYPCCYSDYHRRIAHNSESVFYGYSTNYPGSVGSVGLFSVRCVRD